MKAYGWDIETIPDPKLLDWDLADPKFEEEQTDRVSDMPHEEAVEEFDRMARDGEVVLEETGVAPGLHPTTGRIASMCFARRHREPKTDQTSLADEVEDTISVLKLPDYGEKVDVADWPSIERAEKLLLADCMAKMENLDGKKWTLVTFNGKGFDLNFLRWRCMIQEVETRFPWDSFYFYPFSNNPHTDLRLAFGNGNRYAKGTLEYWCTTLGIEAHSDGGNVWDWVRSGRWDLIDEYGRREGKSLLDLIDRAAPYITDMKRKGGGGGGYS